MAISVKQKSFGRGSAPFHGVAPTCKIRIAATGRLFQLAQRVGNAHIMCCHLAVERFGCADVPVPRVPGLGLPDTQIEARRSRYTRK
jgi:hypothetical protein